MSKIIGRDGYIGSTLELPESDFTVLLAGHSSVKMCENDPEGAWTNNVDFFRATLRSSSKLIYASSASVYDGVVNPTEDTNEFNLKGMYDLTKRTIDNLALLSNKETYGLRFATVNGWSPNLRIDVMLNKMVFDAKTTGKITVVNPQLVRPILGIDDLGRAINAIITSGKDLRGIYNLASFSASVLDMARAVADRYEANITVIQNNNNPYAFGISTKKFEKAFNFEFKDTLETVLDSLTYEFDRVVVRV
jgi:dTDP-4-dehydrorhamnose reductase